VAYFSRKTQLVSSWNKVPLGLLCNELYSFELYINSPRDESNKIYPANDVSGRTSSSSLTASEAANCNMTQQCSFHLSLPAALCNIPSTQIGLYRHNQKQGSLYRTTQNILTIWLMDCTRNIATEESRKLPEKLSVHAVQLLPKIRLFLPNHRCPLSKQSDFLSLFQHGINTYKHSVNDAG